MPKTTTNRSYNNSPHFIISSNLNVKYTISTKTEKTLSCQRKMYYNKYRLKKFKFLYVNNKYSRFLKHKKIIF